MNRFALLWSLGIVAMLNLRGLPQFSSKYVWLLTLLLLVGSAVFRYWGSRVLAQHYHSYHCMPLTPHQIWRHSNNLIPFFAGCIWVATVASDELSYRLTPEFHGQDIVVEGEIVGIPDVQPYRSRFDLAVSAVSALDGQSLHDVVSIRTIRVSWYEQAPELRPGQHWQLQVRLKVPSGHANPGSFDYAGWLFSQRIHATGYVRKSAKNQLLITTTDPLSQLRLLLADKVRQYDTQLQNTGLLQALIIGVRQGVTDQQRDLLQQTGTSHLLAISGLHIGMLAGSGWLLGLMLWWFVPRRWQVMTRQDMGSVLALFAACFYAALAGFTLPTQRALIMLATVLMCRLFRRHLGSSSPLLLALFLVLLYDPLAPVSAGFWLSFGAVVFLLILSAGASPRGHRSPLTAGRSSGEDSNPSPVAVDVHADVSLWQRVRHGWGRNRSDSGAIDEKQAHELSGRVGTRRDAALQWFQSAARMHLGLTLFMFPVTGFFFGQSSLVSPLANFVAIPLVGVAVVPPLVFWVVLSLINDALGFWWLKLIDLVLTGLMSTLSFLAELPFASMVVAGQSTVVWFLLLLVLPLCFLGSHSSARWLSVVFVYPFVAALVFAEKPRGLNVTVLDVGQGLSVVIRTANHTLVYDTGGGRPGPHSMASRVVIPYLHHMGVGRLDALMVSHGDSDHAAGEGDIVAAFDPDKVIGGDTDGAIPCEQLSDWRWDSVDFTILHPTSEFLGTAGAVSDNDGSCVLLVSYQGNRLLLPGDIEAKTEHYLLELLARRHSDLMMPVDVMISPHHGSDSSSTPDWVNTWSPKIAIHSAGYRNRWGFPHETVQMRYTVTGARNYSTDLSGAITLRYDEWGNALPVVEHRRANRRLWSADRQ